MQRYGRKKMRGTATWHPSGDAEARDDLKARARREDREIIRAELDEIEENCGRDSNPLGRG